MLSHPLHNLGVTSRHLLGYVVLHDQLKMLRSLTIEDFYVWSICLIGQAHLHISSSFSLEVPLRFYAIYIQFRINLIYFWLESALCQFLPFTLFLLLSGHLCPLLGAGLPSLMIHVASLARSLQMCLLIGAHLSAIALGIVSLVFFAHFLKFLR